MATIINADNGVASGVPGLKYVSDSTGNLQLQTSGTWVVDTIQLEKGTQATSFDYRNISSELIMTVLQMISIGQQLQRCQHE
jgi:hypothetical protein